MPGEPQIPETGWFITGTDRDPVYHLFVRLWEHMDRSGWRLEVRECQGPGAHDWLVEAGAVGASRIRSKMARAVELAAIVGSDRVDDARVGGGRGPVREDDLASILDHRAGAGAPVDVVVADEGHSVQPGTSGWEGFGR